ncbi:MAG: MAPEG family protein [Micavibrio sp.]|nr:MAPEG family protein [Micavibrio sp.]
MLTGLYAAILAIIQFILTMKISSIRRRKGISIGDGGDEVLGNKVRAHGNFIETVPLALFLILVSELSGAPYWALHVLGVALVIGRILHAIGMIIENKFMYRFVGMVLTLLMLILGAALNVWLALPVL